MPSTADAQTTDLLDQNTPVNAHLSEIRRNRANILAYLLKLNKCIDAQHQDLVQAVAIRFSETLIDYISFGHFQLFKNCQVEPHHVPVIESTTQLALRFNDKYAHCSAVNLAQIKQDLEHLALKLEIHFETEDEIIRRA